jgi:hypothetical protein
MDFNGTMPIGEEFRVIAKPQVPCPQCGYCPQCGRSNQYYPWWGIYPPYMPYTITWDNTSGTQI